MSMATQGKMRRNSINTPPNLSDVSIMMLGLTGSGKSLSGNTILGGRRNTFEEDLSPTSVSRVCQTEHSLSDRTVTISDVVIDTGGLFDASVKIRKVQSQIAQLLQGKNVDVFLLVIKLDETFTKESREAVKWIKENFGPKFSKHSIVLFTHRDELHGPIEDYLNKSEALRSVVDQCSGGFHVFNNKDEDPSQVTELLENIESLRKKNQYMRYTKRDFKKIQDKLLHRKCMTGEAQGLLLFGVMLILIAILAAVMSPERAASGISAAPMAGASESNARLKCGEEEEGGVLKIVEFARAAVTSTMGEVTLTSGHMALIGVALAALTLAALAVYLIKRKSVSKEREKSQLNTPELANQELNSAGQWPSRTDFGHPCPRD